MVVSGDVKVLGELFVVLGVVVGLDVGPLETEDGGNEIVVTGDVKVLFVFLIVVSSTASVTFVVGITTRIVKGEDSVVTSVVNGVVHPTISSPISSSGVVRMEGSIGAVSVAS